MSQRFIRTSAGYGWVRRSWMRLREPRFISAVYGIWYTILTAVWTSSLISPPRTVEHAAGEVLMLAISGIIVCGAVVGVITVAMGTYWAERTTVALVLLGLAGYLGMAVYLEATGSGNRWPQIGVILGAMLLTALRSYWIVERPYNPQRMLPSA